MKKLFTLVALLAVFLGAKAEWKESYKIDYSTYTSFPFYVMGYVPEFVDGIMTDYGSEYRYETEANLNDDTKDGKWKDGESSAGTAMAGTTEYVKVTGAGPYWHQYFIADGVTTPKFGKCRVKALVKASEACTINVNLGWGWGQGEQASASVQIPQSDEFQEVEWSYNNIGGASCNLVAQPGTAAAVIEWKSLIVEVWEKEGGRPKEWVEAVVNGDAEKTWEELGSDKVTFEDVENTINVGAWGKVKGVNVNTDGGSDPFPATIEEDATKAGNHVFVVHGAAADTEGDASAWDNQFWIMSTKELVVGAQYKVSFRYKASEAAKTNTQCHSTKPSDYLHWAAIGDVTFSTDWQTFDKTVTIPTPQYNRPIYSIAFNLNAENKNAVDFYFDDLSIKYLKLDEGFFVTGINAGNEAAEYDYDAAIPFTDEDEDGEYIAIVGEEGNADSYVSEVMISTVRGDDVQFMANTLGVEGSIKNDPENWMDYTESSNTKLKLPGLGVWKIYLDTGYSSLAFEMIEGTEKQPDAIVTNEAVIVVNGAAREDLQDEWNNDKQELTVREDADNNPNDEHGVGGEGHNGQTWDNQFFIVANRALAKGEKTVLKFKYKASVAGATTSTQCHGDPGAYKHWAAIGSLTFGEDWQEFSKEDFTIDDAADGMKCVAFNLAEIKGACDYEFKDFQWYLQDDVNSENKTWENLIDATGTKNFYVKEGAGTTPHEFVPGGTGIENVAAKSAKTSTAIYNLAGQRVSKDFKGIVVKDGKKFVK